MAELRMFAILVIVCLQGLVFAQKTSKDGLVHWTRFPSHVVDATMLANPKCASTRDYLSLYVACRDNNGCRANVTVQCTALRSKQIVFNSTQPVCVTVESGDPLPVILYQVQQRAGFEVGIASLVNTPASRALNFTSGDSTLQSDVCRFMRFHLDNHVTCTIDNIPATNFDCELKSSTEPFLAFLLDKSRRANAEITLATPTERSTGTTRRRSHLDGAPQDNAGDKTRSRSILCVAMIALMTRNFIN